MNRMKTDDSYEQFGKAVSQLNATEKKWKSYKRIIDLFRSNSEYLVQEIQKEFSGQYFQCRDESEVLRAVHMIEVHGFYSALKKDILDNLSFSAGIMKLDSVQLKSLVDFLNSHDGYHLEESFFGKLLSGATPEKISQRMNEIRESLSAVNMVSLAEAMAYQEMGENAAARQSLQYYAGYIEKSYLSTKGLVERLDLIDPAPENYWTKTLPDIKKKIQALPCVEELALLEGENEDGE